METRNKTVYPMTNDRVFRDVFGTNEEATAGLVASVLGIKREDITSVEINESSILDGVEDKEYRLDVRATINETIVTNLEMQVVNENNWEDRSLLYACRNFDNINRGSRYAQIKEVVQIGFLDFTLFKDHPEFHALYQMRNAKDGHLYNSKFGLHVVELNQIDMATEEDIANGLDKWVRLFKAKTVEEMKMIAAENKSMLEAAKTSAIFNEDDIRRQKYWERQEYLINEEYKEKERERLKAENTGLKSENSGLKSENSGLKTEITDLKAMLEQLTKKLREYEK